ncbi:MAG: DNA polymerase III subunit delta [Bdellovibrionales bacterium]
MITLDLRRLQQRLESRAPDSLYLLIGDEAFLMQEAWQLLKTKSVDEATVDFNCSVFDASEAAADTVKDAVETMPMMSQRRFVLFRGAEDLKEKDWEVLRPIIDNPVDSTTFVLACEAIDKRKKAFKRLVEKATVVELKRPYENQVLEWIEYLGHRQGLVVGRESASLLRQFVGTNLTEIQNELSKLKEYLGARTEVETQDILQVVSQSRVDRVFDLTDAIGRRDRVLALQSLANLLEHGQSEVGVLAMITRQFRIMGLLKEGQREGLTGQRLSAKAGIPQFLLTSYLEQLRNWDEGKIAQTFQTLLDTDRALKSTSVPAHVWLENFVLKTCQ